MAARLAHRWIPFAAAAAAVVAVAISVAAHAAGNVPQIHNLSASPKRFCAKSGNGCASTGTTLRFTITTPAKVIADVRPNKQEIWGHRVFTQHFPAGTNSVRVNDTRLTTGRWTFKLQGINSVGAGPPAVVTVRVVKR